MLKKEEIAYIKGLDKIIFSHLLYLLNAIIYYFRRGNLSYMQPIYA
jgi:hypothetical protein